MGRRTDVRPRSVRLTATGRRTGGAALAAVVVGRLVGLPELSILGLTAGAVLALGWTRMQLLRPRLDLDRQVRPRRVHHGDICHVELRVDNPARRPTPVTTLTDHLDGDALAGLSLAPLPGGTRHTVGYRFRARRRGVARLGPVRTTAVDPFGLLLAEAWHPIHSEVVVLPRVHLLAPLAPAPGEQPEQEATARRQLALAHDEASTLREYVAGDDVRHVHWPATARLGRPVVRQVEEPWQQRAVVVLDTRRSSHSEESFERAVSAAASVVVACHRNGEAVRLVRSDGWDSALLESERQVEALLDELAAVQPAARGRLDGALNLAGRASGTLVLCLGESVEERTAVSGVTLRRGRTIVVSCGARPSELPGTIEVRFPHDEGLATAWADHCATAGRSPAGVP